MADQDRDPREGEVIPPHQGSFDTGPTQLPATTSESSMLSIPPVLFELARKYPRSHLKIMNQIKELGVVGGEEFFYAWDAKNRDGTKSEISGLSIKGANALESIYGNCFTKIVEIEYTPTHVIFHAGFIDFQSITFDVRPFQQRRSQSLGGKMDKERQDDIVFQIGVSKAKRNVIANNLHMYQKELLHWAKMGVVERVAKNRKGAEETVDNLAKKHGVSEKRLEIYVGRPRPEWTNAHVAKIWAALTTVEDGMEYVDNVFADGAAPEVKMGDTLEGGQKPTETKPAADAKAAPAKRTSAKTKPAESKPADDKAGAQQAAAQQQAAAKEAEKPKEEKKPEPEPAEDLEQLEGFDETGDGKGEL